MKTRHFIFLIVVSSIIFLFGCQLNSQDAKEKMAFNNFMSEVKATGYYGGKIGNIKYTGNSASFEFTDAAMPQEEKEKIVYQMMALYVNRNNRAQTGVTVLKLHGYEGGKQVVKAVYQAGPSKGDDIQENVKVEWM